MDDLIAWLKNCLDEDEKAARAVAAPKWSRYLEGGDDGWAIESEPPGCDFIVGDDAVAAHIARHDPARVLREVEAKRKILALADEWQKAAVPGAEFARQAAAVLLHSVRLLALPFSDRPGYREEWAVDH